MKIAVVGKGAREHSIVHHIKSKNPDFEIHVLPGNPGMTNLAKIVSIEETNIKDIVKYVKDYEINHVFIGPENSLSLGIIDALQQINVPCFGVNKKASQLESSKIFTKKLLEKYSIATANFKIISSLQEGLDFLYKAKYPKVIKADGLASGKGVFIVQDDNEAQNVLKQLFVNKILGSAADQVLIEDYLEGKEISLFAFIDNSYFLPFAYVQDYKQLYEGNRGPNTGGMGSYFPVSWISENLKKKIESELFPALMKAFHEMQINYQGILYVGLKIKDNDFHVLEFNVRFGDPETQVILSRLENSLIEISTAIQNNKLSTIHLKWKPEHALSIVFALKGYPNKPIEGEFLIEYPHTILQQNHLQLFFSGVKKKEKNLYAQGGRILNLVALDENLEKARNKAYQWASQIYFPNIYYRLDIGNEI